MAPVRVMSTLALSSVLDALRSTLLNIELESAPTNVLLDRMSAGARGDVAILTDEAVQALAASGVLHGGSRVQLARSHVGVAVRLGAVRPDISTRSAVTATLLGARSVALSRTGASGVFMAGLLAHLGIAEEVNRKATFIPSGLTGQLVLSGEADLAIQQVSELMTVPGLDVLGRLPEELGGVCLFSVAPFIGAGKGALDVIATLAEAATLMREKGLEPIERTSSAPPKRAPRTC